MTNQEYSFIEGFVKRASEYGFDEIEAIEMLKSAETIGPIDAMEAAGVAGNDARLRAMEHNKKHHPGHYYLNPIVSGPITKLIHKGLNRTYGNEEKQNKHRANFEKLLKSASPETLAMAPGARTAAQAANNPVHAVQPAPPPGVPAVSLASLDSRNRGNAAPPVAPIKVPRQHLDEALMQPGQRSFTSPR